MTSGVTKPDHWTAESYTAAADFVHKLTNTVLKYLAPSPGDHILDIGCGDGKLSVQIAAAVPQGRVHGLDASSNFINFAQSTFPASKYSNLSFELQDCAKLEQYATHNAGIFDKVFSNAALHWIMKERASRIPTLKSIRGLLKPGGKFVFEMGGAGNVGEVHAALISALVKDGVPIVEAINSSPWFFPSDVLMSDMLTEAGFEVEKIELEYADHYLVLLYQLFCLICQDTKSEEY